MPANDTFDMTQLMGELQIDEGRELKPYKDTVGKITIGVGRNLTDDGISDAECDIMLRNDIEMVCAELDRGQSWWRLMPAPQQRVLVNLCFNMGYATLATFNQFLALMRSHDFEGAAYDLRQTDWYLQVGQRGPRMLARILA